MVRPENDPTARMKVLSRGELLAPACCCICGSSTHDRGYLDIGVFYDYEGQQYFCMECAYQAGETVGLFTPDEVKQLQLLTQSFAEQVADLEKELEDARPIVAAFRNMLDSNTFVSSLTSHATQISTSGAEDIEPYVSGTDGGESGSEESTKSTGRSDVDQFELQYTAPEQPTLD